jgi:hypothetical protein
MFWKWKFIFFVEAVIAFFPDRRDHNLFKSKRIDLVIFSEDVKEPETEKNDEKLAEVYEFKIAKNETSKDKSDEHQRVFDDVVRLAYYIFLLAKK